LKPDRVIYLEVGDEKTVLACFEECLRHRGLAAAVAEVARPSMAASRRLQLAAEESGTIGVAVRRWRRQAEASDYRHPTAATTRWRISVLPSTPRYLRLPADLVHEAGQAECRQRSASA
jgi:protein ImuA